jgi:hypothetical protein
MLEEWNNGIDGMVEKERCRNDGIERLEQWNKGIMDNGMMYLETNVPVFHRSNLPTFQLFECNGLNRGCKA